MIKHHRAAANGRQNRFGRRALALAACLACLLVMALTSATRRGGAAAGHAPQHTQAAAERVKTERLNGREAVAGEVIVKFRDAVSSVNLDAIAAGLSGTEPTPEQSATLEARKARGRAFAERAAAVGREVGAESVEEVGLVGSRLFRSSTKSAAELVVALSARADVEYAEPNYVVRPTAVPNDPQFGQQWGLRNTGQSVQGVSGMPGADIKAATAWDVDTNRGSTANVVGVVDTGVDYNHPDLAANVWSAPAAFTVQIRGQAVQCAQGSHGFNALTRGCDPADNDVNGHGTHVAGIIGAVGDNSAGVAGVNWRASVMGLKFIGPQGGDIAGAVDAISFAVQAKSAFAATGGANVRVLNNSWGPADSVGQSGFSQELLNTINAAHTAEMLFVASAGNLNSDNDQTPYYPASYTAPNVLSAAASNQSDARAPFSNFGDASVDVAAPGVNVLSTVRGGGYGYLSGTSQSAAFVSGAAALVLARCAALDTATLRGTLLDNADGLTALNGATKPKTGQAGTGRRLNVNAALASCASAYPASVTRSLSATGDAYVSKAAPATNFGTSPELQVKRTGDAEDTLARHTYLKFDLSGVSGQVLSAKLRLFGGLANGLATATAVQVQRANATWDEATITWDNQPGVPSPGVLGAATVDSATPRAYEIDLTPFVQSERAASRTTISLRLSTTQATGANVSHYTRFNSKEAATDAPQLVVTTPPSCVSAPGGLVTWYPGDDNARDIRNSNDGVLVNGATFALGRVGQAFNLDGVNDYVEGPTNNVVSGPMSISAWVKQDTIVGTVISKHNSFANQVSWALYYSTGGRLRFVVSQTGGGVRFIDTTNAVSVPGVFKHVAATFDANSATQRMKIYIDGQEVPTTLGAGSQTVTSIFNSTTNVRIGAFVDSGGGPVNFFDGILDEVQVFNRELSAAEIQNIYNAAGAGVCKPAYSCAAVPQDMLAWLPGEGNGSDLQGGNSGTLTNGVTFAAGKVGQAFSFDGADDFVDLPNSQGLNRPVFATDAWVYIDPTQNANSFNTLISKGHTSATDGFYFSQDDRRIPGDPLTINALRFAVAGGSTVSEAYINNAFPSAGFYHVAGTFDGAVARLYLNGALVSTGSAIPAAAFSTRSLRLGASHVLETNGINDRFRGRIDEFHFFNHALTQSEVQAIYNAGTAGLCRRCASPASGLVGWYAGDGNASDFASGNTGTLQGTQGGPTFTTGRVGQAFNLNGINGDHVLVGNPAALRLGSAVTLAAWVNTRDLSEGQLRAVISRWNQANDHAEASYGLYVTKEGGLLKALGATKTLGSGAFGFSGGALQPNTWNHLAFTYDSATSATILYVNGTEVGRLNATGALKDSAGTRVFIGREDGVDQRLFDGLIDEAQIYNRALTAAEIQAIYNAGDQGSCKAFAPNNDNFSDAQLLAGASGGVTGSNARATKERGEPFHAGASGGASVWYKWTAPASGNVQFTTAKSQFSQFPSDFDTLLAAYSGSSLASLTPLASNDDAASSTLPSRIIFNVTQGATYYVAVDGANAQSGFIALSWALNSPSQLPVFEPLANNNIANAQAVGGRSGIVTGTNLGADKQLNEPSHAGNAGGASVWYRWNAPAAGAVTFTTAGSNFDTLLAAYTLGGPSVTVTNLVAVAGGSNDDNTSGGTLTSSVTFNATAGTDYFIAVDGAGDGRFAREGKITLAWRGLRTIGGQVVGGGAGLPSVIVRLSGDSSQETRTDGAGYYSFTNLAPGGSYTIQPSLPGATFSPSQINFCPTSAGGCNVLGSSDFVSANFSAVITGANAVTIAGAIRNANGVGVSGVSVALTGMASRTVTTDGLGRYTLSNLPVNGSYTVTPSNPAYTFGPQPSRSFNTLSNDVLGADFTATQSFSIGGQARVDSNTPLAGVAVTVSRTDQQSPPMQALTDAEGFYSVPVAAGGSYSVTAAKAGVTFGTNTLNFSAVGANVKDADFVAATFGAARIDSVAPRQGRVSGGQQVVLTGSFPAVSEVRFGGVAALIVSQSGTQLVVTTPARSPGVVSLEVVPASGAAVASQNAFAFLPVSFTDDPLVAGVTPASAQHILELRQAVDALRAAAGLPAAQWTDPMLLGTFMKSLHIAELRARMEEAASALGQAPAQYTDPNLEAGSVIKLIHIEELRQRIRQIAG